MQTPISFVQPKAIVDISETCQGHRLTFQDEKRLRRINETIFMCFFFSSFSNHILLIHTLRDYYFSLHNALCVSLFQIEFKIQ